MRMHPGEARRKGVCVARHLHYSFLKMPHSGQPCSAAAAPGRQCVTLCPCAHGHGHGLALLALARAFAICVALPSSPSSRCTHPGEPPPARHRERPTVSLAAERSWASVGQRCRSCGVSPTCFDKASCGWLPPGCCTSAHGAFTLAHNATASWSYFSRLNKQLLSSSLSYRLNNASPHATALLLLLVTEA